MAVSAFLILHELHQHLGDRTADARIPHNGPVVLNVGGGRHVLDAEALLDYLINQSTMSAMKRKQPVGQLWSCHVRSSQSCLSTRKPRTAFCPRRM